MSYAAERLWTIGQGIARPCERLKGQLKHSRLAHPTGEPNKTPDFI